MFLSPRIFRSGKIKSFSTVRSILLYYLFLILKQVLGSIDSAITQRSLPAYQGIQLFYLCKEQADAAEWYKSWGVMENFHGNHGMLMMHIWMVNRRLLQFPDSPVRTEVQESLFEALWADTSARIRAAGISEISVNARLKDVQSWSLPTCMELDYAYTLLHGLQKDSSNQTNADLRGPSAVIDAIGGTIWRQIFQKKAVSAADLPDDQSMAVTETMVEQLAR